MNDFKEINGQDLAIQILSSTISKGHISTAYLFSGPEGVGRKKTAKVFIKSIAKSMCKDGEIFIQSDIFKLFEYMTNIIDKSIYFNRKDLGDFRVLDKNPYDVKTDRELFSLKKNLPIYRAMYIRNSLLFIN